MKMSETISLNPDSLKQWQDERLEYLRYSYDLNGADKVIDIGSYRREWADKITHDFGCHVECFDALDNKAAWLFNGRIAMGGAYYYNSMFAEDKPNEYDCVDIAPYLQQEIALMKINIEGGEYDLLNYIIDKGLMGNIRNLQVQFHLIEGQDCNDRYGELAIKLSVTHKLSWRYPFCWESWELK